MHDYNINLKERLRGFTGAEEYSYTLTVAFCSFVYEMVFSQLITVIFGGAAIRYATTIGLYMFFLGIGSFMTSRMGDPEDNFQRLEIYMALSPLGFIYIIWISTLSLGASTSLALSYLPIIIVGFFSGMEMPVLTELLGRKGERNVSIGKSMDKLYDYTVGLVFDIDRDKESTDFSEILGVDYVGSLVGAIAYAIFLYPRLGLVTTIMIVGALNAVVAFIFCVRRSQGMKIMIITILLISSYGVGLMFHSQINEAVTNSYISNQIEGEYRNEAAVNVTVDEVKNTKYQQMVLYDREVRGKESRCMRLDMAIQMCDRWVESYHNGLVNVPMSMYDNTSNKDVLIIGGGDWIAIEHLRKYGADIDHVDIDREFYNYMKDNTKFSKYHNDSYEYEKLDTNSVDIFEYFSENPSKEYDVILMDVPGLRNHKFLPLYSEEMYTILKNHLTEKGVVVSWQYSPAWFSQNNQMYLETVREAGFDYKMNYHSYRAKDNSSVGERFIILSPDKPEMTVEKNNYTSRYWEMYQGKRWYKIREYDTKTNSLFSPNNNMVIKYE